MLCLFLKDFSQLPVKKRIDTEVGSKGESKKEGASFYV